MTLLQIAQAHCANWRRDRGGCLGAIIDDDLQIRRCIPKPNCTLGVTGQRCRYFEECVMPMAPSIYNPVYRQQFEEAIRQYLVATKLPYADERPCPVCRRPMEPRRRFCHVCAKAQHRANQRAWAANRRKARQMAMVAVVVVNPGLVPMVGQK
jgi:hypothetical protein